MRFHRLIAACAAALGLSLLTGGQAGAAPPVTERVPVDDHITYGPGEFCAFPVGFHAVGRIITTTYFGRDGVVAALSERPNIRLTLTNLSTGTTVTDRDIGLDRLVFEPDGSGTVLSTGVHFKVKLEGGRVVFRRIGLQRIHLDANGAVIDVEIVGGNFDDLAAFDGCQYLA
jgi:hypothetical protein